MTRIAVIADTHDRLPQHVLDDIHGADEIWHLGDVTTPALLRQVQDLGRPLRVVRGNCDSRPEWPETEAFEIEGFSILLIHIPPKKAPAGVNLLLHGHTHVPRNELVGPTRFLNPGCITRPNRGAPASYAWLTLDAGAPPTWTLQKV
ncbi:MAG: metallophosphoesterase family protein [Chthoniobacteraceae bacterium]